ncbi:gas vesicle protein GvpJ [Streptomyces sp. NPDC026665]|uniref:gas vesicle protein GvpJ n=1 Tax=Streptomyces sp. NPDC026665 TaxID=3154798 RepID=UPI0033C36954
MTVVPQGDGGITRGDESGDLYDVLELILDRGLTVDAFARVPLAGIESLRVDARSVVADADTYMRYAAACGRLDVDPGSGPAARLTERGGATVESGARSGPTGRHPSSRRERGASGAEE